MHQLLKIPVLVEHFMEHKTDNQNISFSRFILLHYFGNEPRDADHERDMQLPFKTNNCVVATVAVVVPEPVMISAAPEMVETRSFPKVKDDHHLPNHVKNIFRPPQLS